MDTCYELTKILELRSPGKRVKLAGIQGECALIRDGGGWRGTPHSCHYRRDGRLVAEPGSSTKFAGLSVIKPE